MTKSEIRSAVTQLKKRMTHEEIENYSAALTDMFVHLPEFLSADCLFAYMSYNQEVQTRDLIAAALDRGLPVAVPRIMGEHIEFRFIRSLDTCIVGSFGIQEPDDVHDCADGVFRRVLMLMPGLAFDRTGTRVGYGKGFYDKYLSRYPDVDFTKIALCYDFQLVDAIPADPHDQKADRILTAPSGIIYDTASYLS